MKGKDKSGWEFERRYTDFSFEKLPYSNNVCEICHGSGEAYSLGYVERDYRSAKGNICKTLQTKRSYAWICPKCMENVMKAINAQGDYEIKKVAKHEKKD